MAAIHSIDEIIYHMDKANIPINIYLDRSKAFELFIKQKTVVHPGRTASEIRNSSYNKHIKLVYNKLNTEPTVQSSIPTKIKDVHKLNQ